MDEIMFTTSSLIDLLSQIDELKDVDVGISEFPDGTIQLNVGNSSYDIRTDRADEVEVSQDIVDEISDINEATYNELSESGELSVTDDIEAINSGAVKQLLKTLLVGGIVRLTSKLVK